MNIVFAGSRKIDMSYYLVCLYTAAITFADSTAIFYAIASICIIMDAVSFISSRKKAISAYYFLHVLLIYYCIITAFAGKAMFPSITLRRTAIMTLNLIINIGIAEKMKDPAIRSRFFNYYGVLAIAFELYVVLLSGSRILQGRLGMNANSPLAIEGYYNPNGVGLIILTAMILDIHFYLQKHEKKRLFRLAVFIAGIFLTGSRKAIVSAFIAVIGLPVIHTLSTNRKAMNKLLKYFAVGIVASAACYFILFKIPIVYEIAGSRVEAMAGNFINRDVYMESSLKYRDGFEDIAKQYFLESPIFGIGVDGFSQVSIYRTYSHNNFWELLVGGGVIGFALYYLTYLYLLAGLIRAIKDKKQHALVMLLYLCLMSLMDSYIVSYISRDQLLFLFIAYSICHEQKSGYTNPGGDHPLSRENKHRLSPQA